MSLYPIFIKNNGFDKHKVRTTITEIKYKKYQILNYDKNVLCFNDFKNGIYKNVIYSYPELNVLSFMTPKKMSSKLFFNTFSLTLTSGNFKQDFTVTEFIDGALINLFYDKRIKKWMLATKYQNAKKGFILKESHKVYREFIHLLRGNIINTLNNLPLIEYFEKNRSYNFKIHNNNIYLLNIFEIDNRKDVSKISYIPLKIYKKNLNTLNGVINFPKEYFFSTLEELMETDTLEYFPNKYVITHRSGIQTSTYNTDFEQIKKYNMVPHNIQYLYLCLRRMKNEQMYCKYFPSFKDMFRNMDIIYKNFIDMVYLCYTDYYILRQLPYKKLYMNWAEKIHKDIYIPSLKNKNRIKINKQVIERYFEDLHPREISFIFESYGNKNNEISI